MYLWSTFCTKVTQWALQTWQKSNNSQKRTSWNQLKAEQTAVVNKRGRKVCFEWTFESGYCWCLLSAEWVLSLFIFKVSSPFSFGLSFEDSDVWILSSWFDRGVKEAIFVKLEQSSLNGRGPLQQCVKTKTVFFWRSLKQPCVTLDQQRVQTPLCAAPLSASKRPCLLNSRSFTCI